MPWSDGNLKRVPSWDEIQELKRDEWWRDHADLKASVKEHPFTAEELAAGRMDFRTRRLRTERALEGSAAAR